MASERSTKAIERFAELFLEARNSGVITARKYYDDGSRPKAPTGRATKFLSLIDELSDEQREKLLEGIRYCIDISMFKFLCLLEESEFKLTIETDEIADDLVGPEEDNELRVKYWLWEERFGL